MVVLVYMDHQLITSAALHVSGLGELSRGDRVVTASDRALSDGEMVLPG